MKKLAKFHFSAILSALVLFSAGASTACRVTRQAELQDIKIADVVFIGTVTQYEIIKADDNKQWLYSDTALVTFKIDKMLKGEAISSLRVYWPQGTATGFTYGPASIFGTRQSLSIGKQVIAAALYTNRTDMLLKESSGPGYQHSFKIESFIMQQPCAPALLFDNTPDNLARVKNAVARRPVEDGIAKRCTRWKLENGNQIKTEYPCPEE